MLGACIKCAVAPATGGALGLRDERARPTETQAKIRRSATTLCSLALSLATTQAQVKLNLCVVVCVFVSACACAPPPPPPREHTRAGREKERILSLRSR